MDLAFEGALRVRPATEGLALVLVLQTVVCTSPLFGYSEGQKEAYHLLSPWPDCFFGSRTASTSLSLSKFHLSWTHFNRENYFPSPRKQRTLLSR